MQFSVDPQARSPLHRQLADQIRYAITVGRLVPGDRLPSIRELEAQLDINRNTVRRTYLDLESEGLLILRQGREAQVAPRPRSRSRPDAHDLAQSAEELARTLLERAESEGLDAGHFAEHFTRLAREHDNLHPKWVFLECSARQARLLATLASEQLRRGVIGLDLGSLRADPRSLPTSARFALTTPWHSGEARDLLRRHSVELFVVGVRLTGVCEQALRGLSARTVGLVVRDAESAPGFADTVRKHASDATLRVAVRDDARSLRALIQEVEAVAFTPPCNEIVHGIAPPHMRLCELEFEPTPADMAAVRAEVFPDLLGKPERPIETDSNPYPASAHL